MDAITDSAAGATVFASRVQTYNDWVGIDSSANPKGSILAAAKMQGKGTGIVCTKSVTDATPAAFSAHSMYRSWHQLIAQQQATRQIIDGEPMLDILMGGGRQVHCPLFWELCACSSHPIIACLVLKHFENIGFFNNQTMHQEYGWSTVTNNATAFINQLDDIDISSMPLMGLFGV